MSNAEAAWEVLDFLCKEGVGRRFSDQPFDRSAVARARSRLHFISLRDTCPGTRHIGEAMNSKWIAFTDKQRAATILREVAGLRFEDSQFAQPLQRSGPAHDDVRVEPGGTAYVERE